MTESKRGRPPARKDGVVRKRVRSRVEQLEHAADERRRRVEQRARLIEAGIEFRVRKFHNTPTTYRDERYDSLGEAEYAAKLDALVLAGEIVDWERPKMLALQPCLKCRADVRLPCRNRSGAEMAGFHRERVTYKPDFWILPAEGKPIGGRVYPYGYYVDYKGSAATETAAWILKVKLWRWNVPHELRVAYRDGTEKIVASGNETGKSRDEQAAILIRDAIRSAPKLY